MPYKDKLSSIAADMVGKWSSVLPEYLDSKYLTGKHMACPICQEGKDRFRFDNKEGRGTYFCAQCGSGDGFDLLMGVTGKTFAEVAKQLTPEKFKAERPKPKKNMTHLLDGIASRCVPLTSGDPIMNYLQGRGLTTMPKNVRFAKNLKHYHDGETNYFDAMVSRLSDINGARAGFHVTWLKDGGKAPVQANRKIYKQGDTINGSGVYLGDIGESMVIGEGIETTLAGMQITGTSGVAGLNATVMQSIQLPDVVQQILVLADNDANYTGQKAAYSLANRLVLEGRAVNVAVPDQVGTDFADEVML